MLNNALRFKLSLPCLKVAVALGVTASLSGCLSTFTEERVAERIEPAATPLITALNVQPVVVEETQLQRGDLKDIRDGYADLAEKIDDPALAKQLNLRLADVEMLLAEEEQVSGDSPEIAQQGFERAITAYKKVLEQYPEEASKAEVMYQLSRAYDLQGEGKESAQILNDMLKAQPDSMHAGEAWFRQGEALYADGEYIDAAKAYAKVVESDGGSNFYTMSAYMLGWSYFKLEEQENALKAFDKMLAGSFDRLPEAGTGFTYAPPKVEQLTLGQQKLVKDSLRVMALLFSYRGNGEAIIDFYRYYGDQPHSYLVFDELAQQHLDNDRYLDAAEAYLAFASTHATHPDAVAFYVKHIDAFILGDFPSEVMGAKQGFVDTFGSTKGLYNELSLLNKEKADPYLHIYLQELAQSNHSFAQQLNNPTKREVLPEAFQLLSDDALVRLSKRAFADAARYYREFIDTFPIDELRPQMQFNLAESYYEAGDYENAIEQYEEFAYTYTNHPSANDGAYAALLSYDTLLTLINPESENDKLAFWQAKQRKSRDDFVVQFTADPRAIDVVQTLMQSQFDDKLYDDALFYSGWLLSPPESVATPINSDLVRSAMLVQAHSQFGLSNFSAAELAYQALLDVIPSDDPERDALTRNYAVSMYQQAQYAVEQNALEEAVVHLKRIMANTPNVDVRVNAQYDAASYLLQLQNYPEAQALLLDFQQRFASHELAATIEEKLLFIYEQTEQWQPAAEILYAQWETSKESEIGRESLLLAAEYFEKAGNRAASLPAYRTYAHGYPEPFSAVTEVRFIMSEFYVESGEDSKRRFWLNKLIKGHDGAGAKATARSQTLAAMSAMVFADDARLAFSKIKLTQPLKTSLTKKRQALDKAIGAHNKVMGYGVREYVTAANHQLGTLYRTLAKDLMASDRPANLNALELEQYDILLEEQAYPFEEQAIGVFETNAKRSWGGVYDAWVQASFSQLSDLMPARYRKQEQKEALSESNF